MAKGKSKGVPKPSKKYRHKFDGATSLYVTCAVVVIAIGAMSFFPGSEDGGNSDGAKGIVKNNDFAYSAAMKITFGNPSDIPVDLYTADHRKMTTISPGSDHVALVDKIPSKFYFSKDLTKASKDHVVKVDAKDTGYKFRKNCQDRRPDCDKFKWSCESNPGWMAVQCPHACDMCHMQDSKVRCQRHRWKGKDEKAVKPGDIDATFSTLATRFPDYGVKILSKAPWVATFDNFLTDEEVDAVLSVTGNFKRSTDQGSIDSETGEQQMVESQKRTSTNTWCDDKCMAHPKVKQLLRKIERVTRVPKQNYESLQVLNYKTGQFYATHHDANPSNLQMSAGHRVYTVFLYFSDVDEGGETDFPNLGISVTPKRGKALMWPSLLNETPDEIDDRTMHQAKPVIKGLKLAANVWVHQHDYIGANLWGCTGSFDSD